MKSFVFSVSILKVVEIIINDFTTYFRQNRDKTFTFMALVQFVDLTEYTKSSYLHMRKTKRANCTSGVASS